MKIKFDEKTPIYIQIMNEVKRKIILGDINPGEKLPSVREMSTNFQVNPNTLQRVYQELEREGITYTQRGTGTFVKEDTNMVERLKKETANKIVKDFILGMKSLGFKKDDIINEVNEELKKEVN